MPGPLINPGPGQTGDPVVRFHRDAVREASRKYGIPAAVLFAILRQEGGTSPAGRPVQPADKAGPASFGQFTFATGRSLGVHYGDSHSEVDAVARYLLKLGYKVKEKPNSDANRRAIGGYNGGPGNPQLDYADKVLALTPQYRGVESTALTGVADAVGSVAGGVVDAATAVPNFLGKLDVIFDAGFWRRVGLVFLGVAAVLLGGVLIGKEFTPIGAIAKTFKKG